MTNRDQQALLKRILCRYDDIEKQLRQLDEGVPTAPEEEAARRDVRRKINEIGRELKRSRCHAPLFEMIAKYDLNKFQVVMMLALLRRRLSSESPFLSGRDLVGIPFDESIAETCPVKTDSLSSSGVFPW